MNNGFQVTGYQGRKDSDSLKLGNKYRELYHCPMFLPLEFLGYTARLWNFPELRKHSSSFGEIKAA